MTNTMKAIVIYEAGGPEQFQLEERPIPEVKDGWTLVQIKGFGINHSEIFTRDGLSPSVQFPRILGIECVGEVVETTRRNLAAGQKVLSIMDEMGRAFDGSYAEYVLLPNDQVYTFDSCLPWEQLAAIPETYYTAFGSYKNLQIKEGETLLVRAATAGVGLAFLNLVKAQFPKNRVVGSLRSLKKASLLDGAGYDDLIEDHDGVLQTDEQFDKILELVGPATMKDSFKHVRTGGIVCETGMLGGVWTLDGYGPIVDQPDQTYLTSFHSDNVNQERITELFDFLNSYGVHVKPEKIYSLEQVPDAHRYLEGQAGFGKVVIINK